ncbi:hypothetical protein ACFP56_07225 [Paenibacillus septentrionalis]|uniref:Uncharacterized protein n=1 Tax=Paenibacillus septentrionalis TaxID=429342 RepID=A0ABW1V1T2_9BACL
MHIHIHNQQIKVGEIEVIDVSASANLQIGDNNQVLLYSSLEAPPSGIQIGPFPPLNPYGYMDSGLVTVPYRVKRNKAPS